MRRMAGRQACKMRVTRTVVWWASITFLRPAWLLPVADEDTKEEDEAHLHLLLSTERAKKAGARFVPVSYEGHHSQP